MMTIPICDLKVQYDNLRDEIQAAMGTVLESCAYIMGPQVRELEAQIASFSGCAHGVGVASGTDALRIALAAAGIGPGDEVITSPFTFVATGSAISRCGATPVFADIDPGTFNLDPAAVEATVTSKTRALVPVHLYGQPCDMDAMRQIARRHQLVIIEDGAQAIGAKWNGVPVGALGDAAALSFFPSKNLGAYGDGGMAVTNSRELADGVDMLRRQGARQKYRSEVVGFNSRLDTLQAAILLVKFQHLERWNEARRQAAQHYDALLEGLPVTRPTTRTEAFHVYHQYTIRTSRRDELAAFLSEHQIGNMVYYPVPLHLQPLYGNAGYLPGALPVSESAASEVLSLPMFPELTEAQREYVVSVIRKFFATRV